MDEAELKSRRASWEEEISEWLERLKVMEKSLGLKEKELQQREMILSQREQKLEEQFHVVVCGSLSVISLTCNLQVDMIVIILSSLACQHVFKSHRKTHAYLICCIINAVAHLTFLGRLEVLSSHYSTLLLLLVNYFCQ